MKPIFLLLLGVFFNGLAWLTFLPVWQTPDEQAHFAQVQNLAETGTYQQLPFDLSREIWVSEVLLGTDRDQQGNNRYTYHPEFNTAYSTGLVGSMEASITSIPKNFRTEFVKREATWYPPLYYQLAAKVYQLFSGGSLFERVFVVRFLSTFSLVALTYIAYLVGKRLFDDHLRPLVLALLVGFQPMLTFVHGGVTSDILFNLLAGLFLLFCVRLLTSGLNFKDLFAILLVIWFSFQTKPQANIMAFILIPFLFYLVLRQKKINLRVYVPVLALVSFVAASGMLWRLRNGWSIFPETGAGSVGVSFPAIFEHIRFTLNHTYREVLPWFWGVFRWLSLGLPGILRQITNGLTILSFVGFGYLFIRKPNVKFLFILFVLVIYFLALAAFDYGFRQSHGYSYGMQGRYFFPVIIAQMVIFLVGLMAWFPKMWGRYVTLMLAGGMIIFNVFVFFWVMGSYYSLSWPQFFYQASQYKPVWLKYPVNLVVLVLYLLLSLIAGINLWRKKLTLQ